MRRIGIEFFSRRVTMRYERTLDGQRTFYFWFGRVWVK